MSGFNLSVERLCHACRTPLPKLAPANRRYCNSTCSASAMGGRLNSMFDDTSNALASHELLKRLIRYGWKHDGLPGLSAWEFRALAREIGVAG